VSPRSATIPDPSNQRFGRRRVHPCLWHPVVYAHAMLFAAQRRHGAKVICGARVVDLMMAGDRVTGVPVADGTQYEADTVVNCAGRWTNEATRNSGLHLPLAPTVGFLKREAGADLS
jgi:glycine/D-amino acid oxidase-like deaminating enzyme